MVMPPLSLNLVVLTMPLLFLSRCPILPGPSDILRIGAILAPFGSTTAATSWFGRVSRGRISWHCDYICESIC